LRPPWLYSLLLVLLLIVVLFVVFCMVPTDELANP